MPSPFGSRRSANTYYQYGGEPRDYDYRWTGLPRASYRSAEARGLGADFFDISARFHKELGDYPVAMTSESGASSVLHAGPEQTPLYDAPHSLGFFGKLSRNESRALVIGGVALAGYLAWKWMGGKR